MNFNLNYYDACYQFCALNSILTSHSSGELSITDNLTAKIDNVLMMDDGAAGYDCSDFKITFFRDGKIADGVVFFNNFRKGLEYQGTLWNDECSTDMKLRAMKALSPSVIAKFLQSKPLLTPAEMASVVSKAKEMEAVVMAQSTLKHM